MTMKDELRFKPLIDGGLEIQSPYRTQHYTLELMQDLRSMFRMDFVEELASGTAEYLAMGGDDQIERYRCEIRGYMKAFFND